MNEFILLIRNEMDHLVHLTPEKNQQFLEDCRVYIDNLLKEGKLKNAQPLVREGKIIQRSKGIWKDGPFNETKEVIVGYYHIIARDIDEAIAIAKGNPEFEYTENARIEVRPIKVKEVSTGYLYPKG